MNPTDMDIIATDYQMQSWPMMASSPPRIVVPDSSVELFARMSIAFGSSKRDVDWDAVHGLIQEQFEGLAARVSATAPELVSRAGRSSGRAFPLFSFRSFGRVDDGEDPVIVAITITRQNGAVIISGDISGEESGEVYFDEEGDIVVPDHPDSICQGAIQVATRLASQDRVVLDAIREKAS